MSQPLGQHKDFRAQIVQGLQLEQQRRLEEAAQLYGSVLAADPMNFYALYRSAILRAEGGDNVEALRLIRAAMKREVTPEVAADCAVILERLGRTSEAIENYGQALALRPTDAATRLKQTTLLVNAGQYAKALASAETLLVFSPHDAKAHDLRGLALVNLGRHPEALAAFTRATALDPNYPDAHFHRALTLLTLGDFEAGWAEYEWRFGVEGLAASRSVYPRPHWDGVAPLAGKTILLYTEQGLGDSIMFSRYAPLLAAQGAKVILGVLPAAKVLMTRMDGVTPLAPGDALPAFDIQCPLLSLPHLLQTRLDTIPAQLPYITPCPDRIAAWRDSIPRDRPLTVGVIWAGGRDFKGDGARTIGLRSLAPLFGLPNVRFVSLQRDLREGDAEQLRQTPDVLHVGDRLGDFADTAAIISVLDIVISVDTAVAHLAGAMGKPVWILLPAIADFRWMLGRADSPWYPTATLFRQPAIGDWKSVIMDVRNALRERGSKK